MAEEIDDFSDEDMEEMEEEVKKDKEERRKPVQIKQRPVQAHKTQELKERYIAQHIPERIFIADTVTEEVVATGFTEVGSAMAQAKIMNDINRLIDNSGA